MNFNEINPQYHKNAHLIFSATYGESKQWLDADQDNHLHRLSFFGRIWFRLKDWYTSGKESQNLALRVNAAALTTLQKVHTHLDEFDKWYTAQKGAGTLHPQISEHLKHLFTITKKGFFYAYAEPYNELDKGLQAIKYLNAQDPQIHAEIQAIQQRFNVILGKHPELKLETPYLPYI